MCFTVDFMTSVDILWIIPEKAGHKCEKSGRPEALYTCYIESVNFYVKLTRVNCFQHSFTRKNRLITNFLRVFFV
jgi:hypothetical protein